jgi:hypothetical protein
LLKGSIQLGAFLGQATLVKTDQLVFDSLLDGLAAIGENIGLNQKVKSSQDFVVNGNRYL